MRKKINKTINDRMAVAVVVLQIIVAVMSFFEFLKKED